MEWLKKPTETQNPILYRNIYTCILICFRQSPNKLSMLLEQLSSEFLTHTKKKKKNPPPEKILNVALNQYPTPTYAWITVCLEFSSLVSILCFPFLVILPAFIPHAQCISATYTYLLPDLRWQHIIYSWSIFATFPLLLLLWLLGDSQSGSATRKVLEELTVQLVHPLLWTILHHSKTIRWYFSQPSSNQ